MTTVRTDQRSCAAQAAPLSPSQTADAMVLNLLLRSALAKFLRSPLPPGRIEPRVESSVRQVSAELSVILSLRHPGALEEVFGQLAVGQFAVAAMMYPLGFEKVVHRFTYSIQKCLSVCDGVGRYPDLDVLLERHPNMDVMFGRSKANLGRDCPSPRGPLDTLFCVTPPVVYAVHELLRQRVLAHPAAPQVATSQQPHYDDDDERRHRGMARAAPLCASSVLMDHHHRRGAGYPPHKNAAARAIAAKLISGGCPRDEDCNQLLALYAQYQNYDCRSRTHPPLETFANHEEEERRHVAAASARGHKSGRHHEAAPHCGGGDERAARCGGGRRRRSPERELSQVCVSDFEGEEGDDDDLTEAHPSWQ